MELTLCSPAPCIIIPVLLLSLITFLFNQRNKAKSKINLPPGPPSIPFLGNLHHIVICSSPHQTLRDLSRSLGPVMLLRAGDVKLLVISSRDAAKEVMKVHDAKFAERPILTAINTILYGSTDIAFSNGPYWRQLRKVCVTELLSAKRVKSFSWIRQAEVHRMLEAFSKFSNDRTAVNFGKLASELSNSVVLRAAFGGKCKRQRDFLKVMKEATDAFAWFCPSDFCSSLGWLDIITKRKLARIHRELDSILEEIVQEHLKNPKEQKNDEEEEEEDQEYDLVDILIKEKLYGDLVVPITWDNIKAVIMDVFTGGTDTASNIIVWAMSELIKNPDIMAKAQAEVRHAASVHNVFDADAPIELNYLKLVIKETLRMHPPVVLLLPRFCRETSQLLGYTITSHTIIVVNVWALGRDEDYWHDAEEFKPERFENSTVDFKGNDFEFLPFGAGRRGCPGIGFGTAVVETALAKLLLHFDWKLPDGMRPEDLDMTEEFGAAIARNKPLYVIPVLRVPLPDA